MAGGGASPRRLLAGAVTACGSRTGWWRTWPDEAGRSGTSSTGGSDFAAAAAGRPPSRTWPRGSTSWAGWPSRSTWPGWSRSATPQAAIWPAGRPRAAGLPRGAPGAEPRVRRWRARVAQAGVVDLREAARLGLGGRRGGVAARAGHRSSGRRAITWPRPSSGFRSGYRNCWSTEMRMTSSRSRSRGATRSRLPQQATIARSSRWRGVDTSSISIRTPRPGGP